MCQKIRTENPNVMYVFRTLMEIPLPTSATTNFLLRIYRAFYYTKYYIK